MRNILIGILFSPFFLLQALAFGPVWLFTIIFSHYARKNGSYLW